MHEEVPRNVPFAHHHPGSQAAGPAGGVTERAEVRLRGHCHRALRDIFCHYHDGVLTLRGRLPTYYLKQRAQEAVAGIGGVERVANEIEVAAADRGSSEGGPCS
jgi:osmotically-inducible protein OsmY